MSQDLERIEAELRILHERSQDTKANLNAFMALTNERHENLQKTMISLHNDIKELTEKVDQLKTVATSGRAGLRTLLLVGSTIAAILGLIAGFKGWIG